MATQIKHGQSSYFAGALTIFAGALPPWAPPWWRGWIQNDRLSSCGFADGTMKLSHVAEWSRLTLHVLHSSERWVRELPCITWCPWCNTVCTVSRCRVNRHPVISLSFHSSGWEFGRGGSTSLFSVIPFNPLAALHFSFGRSSFHGGKSFCKAGDLPARERRRKVNSENKLLTFWPVNCLQSADWSQSRHHHHRTDWADTGRPIRKKYFNEIANKAVVSVSHVIIFYDLSGVSSTKMWSTISGLFVKYFNRNHCIGAMYYLSKGNGVTRYVSWNLFYCCCTKCPVVKHLQ